MMVSESQLKASKKYHSKFERIYIRVSVEEKESIETYAEKTGESVNSFVRRAIAEVMERGDTKE